MEERPLDLPGHELRLQVHRVVATAMDPFVPTKEPKESITVTPAEIIYQRRVRVMEHAAKTSVSEACRLFGVSRTTYYRWEGNGRRVWASRIDAKGTAGTGDAEPDAELGRR